MLFDTLNAKPQLNNKQSTDKTIPKNTGTHRWKTILRGFVKRGGRSLP
jgi:hypothetical protein